jgi:hypothetical protein
MNPRIVWSIAALIALAVLVASFTSLPAQREPGPGQFMRGGPVSVPGRFAVAHAKDKQVLVLDTFTGQVYRAEPEDFKKMSQLPRFDGPPVARPFGGDKDRPRPRDDRDDKRDDRDKDAKRFKDKN